MGATIYILRCADGSYYVGVTQKDLETRVNEHQQGLYDGFTARRRPLTLVYDCHFAQVTDAIAFERQVKGWRRDKKGALIRGDFDRLPPLSKRGKKAK